MAWTPDMQSTSVLFNAMRNFEGVNQTTYSHFYTRRPIPTAIEQPSMYTATRMYEVSAMAGYENYWQPTPVSYQLPYVGGGFTALHPDMGQSGMPTVSWLCSCSLCVDSVQQFINALHNSNGAYAASISSSGPVYNELLSASNVQLYPAQMIISDPSLYAQMNVENNPVIFNLDGTEDGYVANAISSDAQQLYVGENCNSSVGETDTSKQGEERKVSGPITSKSLGAKDFKPRTVDDSEGNKTSWALGGKPNGLGGSKAKVEDIRSTSKANLEVAKVNGNVGGNDKMEDGIANNGLAGCKTRENIIKDNGLAAAGKEIAMGGIKTNESAGGKTKAQDYKASGGKFKVEYSRYTGLAGRPRVLDYRGRAEVPVKMAEGKANLVGEMARVEDGRAKWASKMSGMGNCKFNETTFGRATGFVDERKSYGMSGGKSMTGKVIPELPKTKFGGGSKAYEQRYGKAYGIKESRAVGYVERKTNGVSFGKASRLEEGKLNGANVVDVCKVNLMKEGTGNNKEKGTSPQKLPVSSPPDNKLSRDSLSKFNGFGSGRTEEKIFENTSSPPINGASSHVTLIVENFRCNNDDWISCAQDKEDDYENDRYEMRAVVEEYESRSPSPFANDHVLTSI